MLFISEIVRISKKMFFQVWATLNLESHIISVPIFGELKYVGQPLVSGTITMGECTLVINWPKENNDYSFIFITEGTMWRVLAWVLSLLQYFWMCGGIDSDRVGRWILVTAQFKIFAILWLLSNLNKFLGVIVNILPVLFAKMKPCISEVRSKLR